MSHSIFGVRRCTGSWMTKLRVSDGACCTSQKIPTRTQSISARRFQILHSYSEPCYPRNPARNPLRMFVSTTAAPPKTAAPVQLTTPPDVKAFGTY